MKGIRYADIGLARTTGLYIYNRIVFGRLYRYTLPRVRHGFLDSVRESLARELERAGFDVTNPSTTYFISEYYN